MFKYFLIFTLLIVNGVQAQQRIVQPEALTGMVIYQQKIDLRTYVEKLDTLKLNRTKSIFYWNLYNRNTQIPNDIKQKIPNAQFPEGPIRLTGQVNFYDTAKDSIYSRKSMRHLGKVLYLKEKTPSINWAIADSTKEIGNYTVQKATARFRGRDYTAWFTPEIPVPFGPWKLHGLPGLILQAYDNSANIYFSATEIIFKDIGPINPIALSGEEQEVSLNEYKDIMNNFRKHMKTKAIKQVRQLVSKEQMADMKFYFPDFELMEIFGEDSTSQ